MSLRKKLIRLGVVLCLTLTFGVVAFAQETQPQQRGDGAQEGREFGRRGGRDGRRGGRGAFGMMRVLRELNLSDAQEQQARAIFERFAANIKPQRDELMRLREQYEAGSAPAEAQDRARALRDQIHESEKSMRTELLSILTPDQRTQLEQIQAERKNKRDQRRQRRKDAQPDVL